MNIIFPLLAFGLIPMLSAQSIKLTTRTEPNISSVAKLPLDPTDPIDPNDPTLPSTPTTIVTKVGNITSSPALVSTATPSVVVEWDQGRAYTISDLILKINGNTYKSVQYPAISGSNTYTPTPLVDGGPYTTNSQVTAHYYNSVPGAPESTEVFSSSVTFYVDLNTPGGQLGWVGNSMVVQANDSVGLKTVELYANGALYQTLKISTLPGTKTFYQIVSLPVGMTSPFSLQAKITDLVGRTTFTPSVTIPVFTITASVGAGGGISPAGAVAVPQSYSQTFTILPDFGNDVDSVIVDGVSKGKIYTYSFSNVTSTHTISATFVPTFSIRATSDPRGRIFPSGVINLSKGASQLFTASPNLGNIADGFTVDGVATNGASYTFQNLNGINGTHSIIANFYTPTRQVTDTARIWMVDVNGDGKADMVSIQNGGIVYTALSNGSGTPGWSWSSGTRKVNDNAKIFMADVNGDGKSDMICVQNAGIVYVSLSDGQGFPRWDWNSGARMVNDNAQIWLADINGDGMSDMVCVQNNGIVYVGRSNGFGFPLWDWNSGGRMVNDNARIWMADVNGDRMSDMVCVQNNGIVYVGLSNGSGMPSWNWNSGARMVNDNARIWMADVDGDHMSDIVCVQNNGIVYFGQSFGNGFTGWSWSSGVRMVNDTARIWMADINGDAKEDLICVQNNGIVYVSTKIGAGAPVWSWDSETRMAADISQIWMADINGDKKSDLICVQNGGIIYISTNNGFGAPAWSWASH